MSEEMTDKQMEDGLLEIEYQVSKEVTVKDLRDKIYFSANLEQAHACSERADYERYEKRSNEELALFDSLVADAAKLPEIEAAKDGAYKERNALVCLLSKVFHAWLERHDENDKTWEDDWRWIVFIDLPTGQCSWHIHDSEIDNFEHLPFNVSRDGHGWDGHTTEEKYKRIADMGLHYKAVQIADEDVLQLWTTEPWLRGTPTINIEDADIKIGEPLPGGGGIGALACPSND